MPEVNPQDAILAHVLKRKEEEKIESKDKDNKKHLDEVWSFVLNIIYKYICLYLEFWFRHMCTRRLLLSNSCCQ